MSESAVLATRAVGQRMTGDCRPLLPLSSDRQRCFVLIIFMPVSVVAKETRGACNQQADVNPMTID